MKALAGLALALAFCLPASAQSIALPRTPQGHPDFQGVWDATWLSPLERLDGFTSRDLGEEDAARLRTAMLKSDATRFSAQLDTAGEEGVARELVRIGGAPRSSLVVDPEDGRIPRKPGAAAPRTGDSNPEELPNQALCLGSTGRVPLTTFTTENIRQIIQTPETVIVHTEYQSELRIFRFAEAHRPEAVRSDLGDSIARWEGDTLVVETTHLDGRRPLRLQLGPGLLFLGPNAKVTERFSFDAPDEIIYRFTISDPDNYTRPWSGEYNMRRSNKRIYPFECHEGNYSVANILRGARERERRAVESPHPAEPSKR